MAEISQKTPLNLRDDAAFLDAVARYLDDSLSEEQVAEFLATLGSDPTKVSVFVDMCLVGKVIAESLGAEQGSRPELNRDERPGGIEDSGEDLFSTGVTAANLDPPTSGPGVFGLPPLAECLSQTGLSQAGVFSCLTSMLIVLCIAVLVGWGGNRTGPWDVQSGERPVAAVLNESGGVLVGRITGMVDCEWGNDEQAPSLLDYVAVGRRLRLDSGVLEITYDTGARVVLQGPATYEVCANGGYLLEGKLAGKFEARSASASTRDNNNTAKLESWKSGESAGDSRRIGNRSSDGRSSSFVIRTPTATVVDLGTEFGVAVDRQGTTSHVFRGSIELRPIFSTGPRQDFVLKENESVRIEIDDNLVPRAHRVAVQADQFIRYVYDWRKG